MAEAAATHVARAAKGASRAQVLSVDEELPLAKGTVRGRLRSLFQGTYAQHMHQLDAAAAEASTRTLHTHSSCSSLSTSWRRDGRAGLTAGDLEMGRREEACAVLGEGETFLVRDVVLRSPAHAAGGRDECDERSGSHVTARLRESQRFPQRDQNLGASHDDDERTPRAMR